LRHHRPARCQHTAGVSEFQPCTTSSSCSLLLLSGGSHLSENIPVLVQLPQRGTDSLPFPDITFRPTQFAVCLSQRWQNQIIHSLLKRLHNVCHSFCFNIFLCCSFLYW